MSGLSPRDILDAEYGSYKGYFAENFVAQQLLAYGRDSLFSWQEKSSEVDFLLDIDGYVIPVEVKSGSVTNAKSLQKFSEKYKPPYQIIYSGSNLHNTDSERGVIHYPLYLAGMWPK